MTKVKTDHDDRAPVPAGLTLAGEDEIGRYVTDGEDYWYITDCCGASATGGESAILCRGCYQGVDPDLAGEVDEFMDWIAPDPVELLTLTPSAGAVIDGV